MYVQGKKNVITHMVNSYSVDANFRATKNELEITTIYEFLKLKVELLVFMLFDACTQLHGW